MYDFSKQSNDWLDEHTKFLKNQKQVKNGQSAMILFILKKNPLYSKVNNWK